MNVAGRCTSQKGAGPGRRANATMRLQGQRVVVRRASGTTVAGRRCGHRSSRGSAPASTHDQPTASHFTQCHCFRRKMRAGGASWKWPSACVILPAPVCRGTSNVSDAPPPFSHSGQGHGNCRCSWRCIGQAFIGVYLSSPGNLLRARNDRPDELLRRPDRNNVLTGDSQRWLGGVCQDRLLMSQQDRILGRREPTCEANA